jgi:hypothetical protein
VPSRPSPCARRARARRRDRRPARSRAARRGVREIRDEVEEHVRGLIVERLEEIQADRSAHQWRLRKLVPALIEQFEGKRSSEEIRACADAILDRYDEVPVRSHILALASRAARDCLERDHCDALTAA